METPCDEKLKATTQTASARTTTPAKIITPTQITTKKISGLEIALAITGVSSAYLKKAKISVSALRKESL